MGLVVAHVSIARIKPSMSSTICLLYEIMLISDKRNFLDIMPQKPTQRGRRQSANEQHGLTRKGKKIEQLVDLI